MRIVKITAGMTGEYEIISTNAPDSIIRDQLTANSLWMENGEDIENPYALLEQEGYIVNVLGSQDDDMEDTVADVEFDFYEY